MIITYRFHLPFHRRQTIPRRMRRQCCWAARREIVAPNDLMDILRVHRARIRIQIKRSMDNRRDHTVLPSIHQVRIRLVKAKSIDFSKFKSISAANWSEFLPPPPEHPPPLPLSNCGAPPLGLCYVPNSPGSIRRATAAQWAGSGLSNHQK